MKSASRLALAFFVFASIAVRIEGATITTEWKTLEDRSVVGTLAGVVVAGSASEQSPFGSISTGRFGGDNWQAEMALPMTSMSVSALDANSGDSHAFIFSEALTSVMLYIENFDSNSSAEISLQGTGTLSLLSESPSISFETTSDSTGILTSSNALSDGEGDLVLALAGEIQSIAVDYVAGDGANGVFYTLAVPEPAGFAPFAIGLVILCRCWMTSRCRDEVA